MTDPDPIVTSDLQVYRHPIAVVSIADALRDADFVEVRYLRCEQLTLTAAPDIDTCQLSYTYGKILREDLLNAAAERTLAPSGFNPKDLNGKFVKVVIRDTVFDDAFAEDEETEVPDESITWFGVVECDSRETAGTTPGPENQPQGFQLFTALGLLRLADKEPIRTAMVARDTTTDHLLTVRSGLPFNTDPGGQFTARGNRSATKPVGVEPGFADSPSYVFNWEPRGFAEWTAYTAAEYLLAWHSPKQADGTAANKWRFADDVDEDFLNWYQITQPTEGLTLKGLLDELISRFRGVGYWIEFDITRTIPDEISTAANEVLVHVFTFNKTDLTLSGSKILKANPNQKSLNFEAAFDIEQATVGNVSTQLYHRVIARGAKRTTTFTARIRRVAGAEWQPFFILGAGWTAADEAEYKTGASGAADYSSLTIEQKQARNAIYRQSSDRLREVFRRFIINPRADADHAWDCQIPRPHAATSLDKWWLRGDITSDPFDAAALDDAGDAVNEDYVGDDYLPGLHVMRGLPLYERHDYSGTNLSTFDYATAYTDQTHPSFIPLIVYARTFTGDAEFGDLEGSQRPHQYELTDRFHQKSFDAVSNRDWSCRLHTIDTEPGIELHADVPHFIGGPEAGGSGYAETADTQKSSLHSGMDYTDLWGTLCVELSEHAERQVVLSAPATNAPENVLMINAPHLRHDYVIPFTTVEIKDGLPVETTTGGAAKNDLAILEDIAKAAAHWHSTVRQTLDLRWKQIRGTFKIGWLITDVGGRYQLSDINTPITSIQYNLGGEVQPGQVAAGHTQIGTAYTSLDFTP